jgi:ElaB/YqjD/DUF883 family membrane-anchored ribosome-binding protein
VSDRKSSPQKLSEAIRRLETTTGNGNSALGEDLSTIKRAFEELKPHLSQWRDDATKVAGEALEETSKRAKEMGRNVDRQVHENPWAAIGVAGLLAFLIGFLLGRRD